MTNHERHGLSLLKRNQGEAHLSRTIAGLSSTRVRASIAVLMTLIFSKFVYLASFTSYYTFYLMHHFHISLGSAQILLPSLGERSTAS